MSEAILIDLSAVVHTCWHATTNEPNPDQTSINALDIIRRAAMGSPANVAIACDSKRSLRREADPTYKANRPKEDRAPLYHQMDRVLDALKSDGFPCWSVDGYEADDVIASAVAEALKVENGRALVLTTDKDLLCLVNERVTLKKLDGTLFGPDAVREKFGIDPHQMTDWLCLVGDSSDNVKGADGIGPKRATELLTKFSTIEGIHAAWAADASQFTPALSKSLGEFWPRVDGVRSMIQLRRPEIPFSDIAVERQAAPQVVAASDLEDVMPDTGKADRELSEEDGRAFVAGVSNLPPKDAEPAPATPELITANGGALVRAVAQVPAVAPTEWEKQLEPRSMDEARMLAKFAFESRLFGAYGSPQAVLMTVMAGRDFGMSAMASLRAFHVISGKPVLAADAIRALVLKSGKVKFFRCAERTAERCTFIAQRHEDDAPTSLTFTLDEAKAAGLVKPGSQWTKGSADMLVARASAKLARLVAPEVTFGLYAPEEME